MQDAAGDPLSGRLAAVVVMAAIVAYPVSRLLLSYYRRRVIRGMGTVSPTPPGELPDDASHIAGVAAPHAPARVTLQAHDVDDRTRPLLYTRAERASRRTALIYAMAGLCYAIVIGASYTLSAGSPLDPFVVAFVAIISAWPAVLSANIVAVASRRERIMVVAMYGVCLITTSIYALATSSTLTAGQIVMLWLLVNLPATLVLAGFLSRSIRAVGPLVWSFMLVSLAGMTVGLDAAATGPGMRLLADFIRRTGLDASSAILAIALLGGVLIAPVGYLAGRWIGRRYERKQISDQSITVDAMWLGFAVVHSIGPVASGGPVWLLAGAAAFASYKAATWAGFRFVRTRGAPSSSAPRLLLLRAFSLGRRSEQLLDQLARKWRYVGSIQLITGPDLATSTIEPHEFLDFLRGRMSRLFIDRPETLERKVAELDLEPDHDGRFRVNEFFCHDNMWRRVMLRLVPMSDVILLDLRGFSRQHAGLTFEIRQLIQSVLLERVVILVDESTDETYLQELAAGAWLERNDTNESAVMRLLKLSDSGPGEQSCLLAAVCEAVQTAAIPVHA